MKMPLVVNPLEKSVIQISPSVPTLVVQITHNLTLSMTWRH
ncbi:hypothetical protein THF1C08_320116 [Vibrio jasicida]|uniref:Uncharacterized protein n=1 Tax=Vibrio jasicida TaxID=766224 RepID=A0AAU9QPE7_9VIBR|nr:hypothetical protein THF1C08_320116 [Vibrio jasicida]CAH1597604.1 hypothetical protein THF1A12_320117 [Vibrio jasicida]